MTQLTPSALDRRSGNDRRQGRADASVDVTGDRSTSIAPPFVLGPELEGVRPRDPWVSVVARSIDEYCAGRIEELVGTWDEALIWRVVAAWPQRDRSGASEVFAWHRAAQEATGGTFRQEILALDGSGGPIVVAHVRTTASRGTRQLETPSMLTFELAAMRIRRVTEIPGDASAWDRFWAD
jgi:hypothetical protein